MPILLEGFINELWKGDPELYLTGTGKSNPPGIESYLEYNGVTMNDHDVLDEYFIKQIDGLEGPNVRDNRAEKPEEDGETVYDSYYGGRTLVLTGFIRCGRTWKLRDMQQAMYQAFMPLVEKPLVFKTGEAEKNVYIMCRKTEKISMVETQSSIIHRRDFSITLKASNPRILSVNTKQITIPTTSAAQTIVQTVNNAGTYKAQPIIRLQGPLTNPTIYNQTPLPEESIGRTFKILGNVPAGTYYEYNFETHELVNAAGVNKSSQLSVASQDILFGPGNNILNISFTGGTPGSSSFNIAFRDTWL